MVVVLRLSKPHSRTTYLGLNQAGGTGAAHRPGASTQRQGHGAGRRGNVAVAPTHGGGGESVVENDTGKG